MSLRILYGAAMAAATALLALGASGCSGDEYTGTEVFVWPDKSAFTGIPVDGSGTLPAVSSYMERRCGTLDCHGSALIPMRLYGQFGRRHPDEMNFPGGLGTTAAELEANYGTVCSVEPEKTAEQAQNLGQTADTLLIVRKARGTEGHKGGTILKEGDAADKCILGWLRNNGLASVTEDCKKAIAQID